MNSDARGTVATPFSRLIPNCRERWREVSLAAAIVLLKQEKGNNPPDFAGIARQSSVLADLMVEAEADKFGR